MTESFLIPSTKRLNIIVDSGIQGFIWSKIKSISSCSYDKASSPKICGYFPDTFNHLNQSLYVDDFLRGNVSVQAALTTCIESKQILEDASMDLRKWRTNSSELNQSSFKGSQHQALDCPMGRILEVFPGSDGLVRVVNVKTSTGILKRAITKVVPFYLFQFDPATVEKNIEHFTIS
ncbi:hypothetical protein TNCV_4866991 [Trichonephila clavipes]|nr:hypothetical protein TNCV_4866991 [Trichonephila clavipes]